MPDPTKRATARSRPKRLATFAVRREVIGDIFENDLSKPMAFFEGVEPARARNRTLPANAANPITAQSVVQLPTQWFVVAAGHDAALSHESRLIAVQMLTKLYRIAAQRRYLSPARHTGTVVLPWAASDRQDLSSHKREESEIVKAS